MTCSLLMMLCQSTSRSRTIHLPSEFYKGVWVSCTQSHINVDNSALLLYDGKRNNETSDGAVLSSLIKSLHGYIHLLRGAIHHHAVHNVKPSC